MHDVLVWADQSQQDQAQRRRLESSLEPGGRSSADEADVSNTGSRAGEELVQLYVRLQGTSTAQPVRALKGYQRIALAPGETKKVKFNLEPDAFAIWNDHNEFAFEPAKVTVWISPDSAGGSEAKLEILP
ncbi:MAG: fibronectin type III-like domain-contianing protein [Acidobacteriia bacterium]|nr:fibronectin type III-like domain-contianing protein [Terriglobia bacterium]